MSDFKESHGVPKKVRAILLPTSTTEDDEEEDEEESPESLYNTGEIDVHEYKSLKAQHRVDGLLHVVEEVTGINPYDTPDLKPPKKFKTIGFIQ